MGVIFNDNKGAFKWKSSPLIQLENLTITAGRKTQTYDFPLSSKRLIQDLGQAPKTFTVSGVINLVNNDSQQNIRDSIKSAFEAQGSGDLTFPSQGITYNVALIEPASIIENIVNSQGILRVNATFSEVTENIKESKYKGTNIGAVAKKKDEIKAGAVGGTLAGSELAQKLKDAKDGKDVSGGAGSFGAKLENLFNTTLKKSGQFKKDLIAKINDLSFQMQDIASQVQAGGGDVTNFLNSIEVFTNSAGILANSPSLLIQSINLSITSLEQAMERGFDNVANRDDAFINQVKILFNQNKTEESRYIDLDYRANRSAEFFNTLNTSIQVQAFMGYAERSTVKEYTTSGEISSVKNDLTEQFNELDFVNNPEIKDSVEELYLLTMSTLDNINNSLPAIKTITVPYAVGLSTLAYVLYLPKTPQELTEGKNLLLSVNSFENVFDIQGEINFLAKE